MRSRATPPLSSNRLQAKSTLAAGARNVILAAMAWRLEDHVTRGEIDNRTHGCVTGCIWLAGVEEPLLLELEGNCHPDLAGCLLVFENSDAIPLPSHPPILQQRGRTGDMTASRKM